MEHKTFKPHSCENIKRKAVNVHLLISDMISLSLWVKRIMVYLKKNTTTTYEEKDDECLQA